MQHRDGAIAIILRATAVAGLSGGLFEINMNPENQDFESLRRLLKLKRYEQPPPRYFNDFSGQVINRIRAGYSEDRAESLAATAWKAPWLQRVLSVLETKPLVAGAFGAAVIGVLVGGAVYSDKVEISGPSELAGPQIALPAAPTPVAVGNNAGFALGGGGGTNVGTLFDRIQT